MVNIISHCCPRCNSHSLYKYIKDKFGNKNTNAVFVYTNLLRTLLKRLTLANILLAPFVASAHFFITITTIIQIIIALIIIDILFYKFYINVSIKSLYVLIL